MIFLRSVVFASSSNKVNAATTSRRVSLLFVKKSSSSSSSTVRWAARTPSFSSLPSSARSPPSTGLLLLLQNHLLRMTSNLDDSSLPSCGLFLTPTASSPTSGSMMFSTNAIARRRKVSPQVPPRFMTASCNNNNNNTTDLSSLVYHRSKRHFVSSTVSSSGSIKTDSSSSNNGGTPFLLADIGEGIKEVELLQWFVQPGDTLHQFDKVCEVQSDKATVEITSRYDGIVSSLAGQVGDMLQVGQPLLWITQEQQQQQQQQPTSSTTDQQKQDQTEDVDVTVAHDSGAAAASANKVWDDVLDERLQIPTIASHYRLESDPDYGDDHGKSKFEASPAVRKLGKEYKLDLTTIHPSGPHGRLLKSDVITYLKEKGQWEGSAGGDKDESRTVTTATTTTSLPPPLVDADGAEIVQLKGYHRRMHQSMTAALQIPHMCFGDELVVSKLVECRHEINHSAFARQPQQQQLQQQRGEPEATATTPSPIHLSLLAFLIKATSLALTEYPMVNAVVHDAQAYELKLSPHHNIGIAVDTPRGLVVPVIRSVQNLSLLQIQEALDQLKVKARDSKLSNEDIQNATFTLSNIGVIGGTYMQPVIVPPQVAMGAVGKLQKLPRFDNQGNVIAADVMHVSWAGDHRFLDGATLARFHTAFKRYVENPTLMLVQMK